MRNNPAFLTAILDSVVEQIAVVDSAGVIVFVNAAWRNFGTDNACSIAGPWEGVNYLATCDAAAGSGDQLAEAAARGMREVLNGTRKEFCFEYPCHSPDEQRWFMMSARPLRSEQLSNCFVVVHQNITHRKQLEEKLRELALTDELTGLENRRHFDRFLEQEWRRCQRDRQPVSLLLIDVDFFKQYNDEYGHLAGDDCLAGIGSALKSLARRPGDLAARYGGEEFALLLSGTDRTGAEVVANRALQAIRDLEIEHRASEIAAIVTISVGVTCVYPASGEPVSQIIGIADDALYAAKESGRDRYVFADAANFGVQAEGAAHAVVPK